MLVRRFATREEVVKELGVLSVPAYAVDGGYVTVNGGGVEGDVAEWVKERMEGFPEPKF